MRDHLLAVQRQTGIEPPELKSPPFPVAAEYVWQWFLELNAARQSNGFSVLPISNLEMDAFFRMSGEQPTKWELSVLRALDRAALEATPKPKSKPGGT